CNRRSARWFNRDNISLKSVSKAASLSLISLVSRRESSPSELCESPFSCRLVGMTGSTDRARRSVKLTSSLQHLIGLSDVLRDVCDVVSEIRQRRAMIDSLSG